MQPNATQVHINVICFANCGNTHTVDRFRTPAFITCELTISQLAASGVLFPSKPFPQKLRFDIWGIPSDLWIIGQGFQAILLHLVNQWQINENPGEVTARK